MTDLTEAEFERLRALHDAQGLPQAAKTLNIGRETLLRLLARTAVHRGTVLVVREALQKLDANRP